MAEPLKLTECPSLETIGAFIDGRFKDREREVIADHLASCETCYFVFSEAARTRVTAQPAAASNIRRFVPRQTWQWVAGLAAAAAVVLAVNVWQPFGTGADERALTVLVDSVGTARTFDARLTGGFAYAPVRGPVRGSNDAANLSPDVRIAIAEIEKQFAARPVAATAAMIGGDAVRAVGILESAVAADPNNARVLSDLAAARLVLAQRTEPADNASRALEMANRALESNRQLPEALFNRALALEALGQKDDAKAAWQAYLAVDGRSGWADEARAKLRILSAQP